MTVSSWLNVGRPAPPEWGLRWGEFFLSPAPYYSQLAVFASLWALFSLQLCHFQGLGRIVNLSACLSTSSVKIKRNTIIFYMTLSDLERRNSTGPRMLVPFDSALTVWESFPRPHRLTSNDQIRYFIKLDQRKMFTGTTTTLPFQAQNSPVPQIFSTIVC